MGLNQTDVNNCLLSLLGQDEDNFQQAWVEILESNVQTLEEITPVIKRVKNNAIRQYWNKKSKEVSLYKPIGRDGDDTFTLESILPSPTTCDESEESNHGDVGFYKKIVDFLISEYFIQKAENRELKKKETEVKAERLRLRSESLRFRKDRFESWKKLMEEKGKLKEAQFKVRIQFQREKLEFRKQQLSLKEKKRIKAGHMPR
jgi:hypothetical protein